LKRFDFGLGAGLGIELSSRYTIGVGYQYGLANLSNYGKSDGYSETIKSGIFNLSIGYLF
jgi:opacity protein-like surface antigen